jgi:hypothetical protein
MRLQKLFTQFLPGFLLMFFSSAAQLYSQNIGIGVTDPQKGKLEIAGALGNHTTVLTIGSDGTGISLQRNWPTIGLNQYRDSSNTQRFIGTGHAGSIFLSADDGSIIFSQFGQGSANALITTASYPLYISGNGIVNIPRQLNLETNATLTTATGGAGMNMLPLAFGSVRSDGVKVGGTDNFTCRFVPSDNDAFHIEFSHSVVATMIVVTPRSLGPRYATCALHDDNTYEVRIWDKNGLAVQDSFGFIIYNR